MVLFARYFTVDKRARRKVLKIQFVANIDSGLICTEGLQSSKQRGYDSTTNNSH